MENKQPLVAVGRTATPLHTEVKIKYCLYARKSSEDDERQALSIDSQIKEMLAMAERDGMEIAEVRNESHSAKASGMRPVYNQLIADIRSGMFNGILTWAPDRLSRNAGDLGALVDMMDQGLLKEIRTHGQKFTNSPNEKFLLMILCSQAKLENDNKGINVKRGQRARLETGHRPCLAPLGYLNEKIGYRGQSRIIVDPQRAPIVKEVFNKVAHQFYTGQKVKEWLDEIGFTTRSGKKVTKSGIFRILSSPYYYGEFEWPEKTGNWYKGNYEPLITKELFERARGNLISAPFRAKNKEYNYTKLMSCGHCGSGITAEDKIKKLSDGKIARYVYYHCTKFYDMHCPERFIREEDLVDQLLGLIETIDLDQIGINSQLQEELEKYKNFSQGVLGKLMETNMPMPVVDARSYAKYVLQFGNREDKRNLLKCLKSKIYLRNQKIILGKEGGKKR